MKKIFFIFSNHKLYLFSLRKTNAQIQIHKIHKKFYIVVPSSDTAFLKFKTPTKGESLFYSCEDFIIIFFCHFS